MNKEKREKEETHTRLGAEVSLDDMLMPISSDLCCIFV